MNTIPMTYETIIPPLCNICHDKPVTCKVELKVHPKFSIWVQTCDGCSFKHEYEIKKAIL